MKSKKTYLYHTYISYVSMWLKTPCPFLENSIFLWQKIIPSLTPKRSK